MIAVRRIGILFSPRSIGEMYYFAGDRISFTDIGAGTFGAQARPALYPFIKKWS